MHSNDEARRHRACRPGGCKPAALSRPYSATGWLVPTRFAAIIQPHLIHTPRPPHRPRCDRHPSSRPGPFSSKGHARRGLPMRARASSSPGELGRSDLLPIAQSHLKAEDPEVRFSAAWSTAVLSPKPEALSALATIAQSNSRHGSARSRRSCGGPILTPPRSGSGSSPKTALRCGSRCMARRGHR